MIDVPSQPRSGMRKWGALAVVLGIQGHLLEVTSKPSPVAASDMDGRVHLNDFLPHIAIKRRMIRTEKSIAGIDLFLCLRYLEFTSADSSMNVSGKHELFLPATRQAKYIFTCSLPLLAPVDGCVLDISDGSSSGMHLWSLPILGIQKVHIGGRTPFLLLRHYNFAMSYQSLWRAFRIAFFSLGSSHRCFAPSSVLLSIPSSGQMILDTHGPRSHENAGNAMFSEPPGPGRIYTPQYVGFLVTMLFITVGKQASSIHKSGDIGHGTAAQMAGSTVL
ncbi:hypothetical protein V499_01965 [Pseudogymnoascus sp. VKM F-103]|nr:hypothetical protein V499_01965 [Pseudogymnoascus sp. VKM F-103]